MNFATSLKYMKYAINNAAPPFVFLALLYSFCCSSALADSFDDILKDVAVRNGLATSASLINPVDAEVAEIGRGFFESRNLSNYRDVSCRDCHLNEFSSTDGIPIAVGINGKGIGRERAQSAGEIIPRNTLALWGRGHKGFDTFFWDGRVELLNDGSVVSQFGGSPPSFDPLTVAVHLPLVEIKEMLVESKEVKENKLESVSAAQIVFEYILDNLKSWEPELIARLAEAKGLQPNELSFLDVADSLSSFIRSEFRPRSTKFERFVFENQSLTTDERDGALLFYGKAKCAVCHSGPYFSDFLYHTVPFPQLGAGKNGFGIDYGRFNVTHDPADLYKFRTPPLINVASTSPYGHSGSVNALEEAVTFHFDPLRDISMLEEMADLERTEYYKLLTSSNESLLTVPYLNSNEIAEIVAFLRTLSF